MSEKIKKLLENLFEYEFDLHGVCPKSIEEFDIDKRMCALCDIEDAHYDQNKCWVKYLMKFIDEEYNYLGKKLKVCEVR